MRAAATALWANRGSSGILNLDHNPTITFILKVSTASMSPYFGAKSCFISPTIIGMIQLILG